VITKLHVVDHSTQKQRMIYFSYARGRYDHPALFIRINIQRHMVIVYIYSIKIMSLVKHHLVQPPPPHLPGTGRHAHEVSLVQSSASGTLRAGRAALSTPRAASRKLGQPPPQPPARARGKTPEQTTAPARTRRRRRGGRRPER
jgi:hypothetical protein